VEKAESRNTSAFVLREEITTQTSTSGTRTPSLPVTLTKKFSLCFKRNPVAMTDELRWTPELPFRYYMLGFRDSVMTRDFDFLEISNAASCFLGLIAEKLRKQRNHILPIIPELLPAIEFVARNQMLIDADEKIYGSCPDKLAEIQGRLRSA
jgi:hypothetical protein